MRARRAKTIPRQIAPIAITAHPISAVVPKRASAEGAMKNPEPTMLPITRAVQVVSPRLRCPVSSPGAVGVTPFMALRGSFRQRDEAEERQDVRVGLPKEALVDVPDLARAVEAAEGAIHEQAEILVAPREGKGERLVGELAFEDDQIVRRWTPRLRVQKDRPVSEQHVRAPPQYPVDAFPVALHRDDLCVDVELLSPLGKPGFRGCPRQGREHPLLEDLS